MSVYEIISLIVSILSLIATVAVSIVIFLLENRRDKKMELHRIYEDARRFLYVNSKEKDYLIYAIIASGCYPGITHCRKIYNEFALLEDKVKIEVLKQANIDIPLINDNTRIDDKLELVKKAVFEMDLGDCFLYDHSKNFYKLYNYKSIPSLEFDHRFNEEKYDDVFSLERYFSSNKNGKISFLRYLDDYLYIKYEKPDCFSSSWKKPLDYLIEEEYLRTTRDQNYVSYCVARAIEYIIGKASEYFGYQDDDNVSIDSIIETCEDRYFQTLYFLYCFSKGER